MDENKNPEVQTPDFDQEEMKMPENAPVQNTAPESSGQAAVNGPLLLILAVLLALVLGGMYFWFNSLNSANEPLPSLPAERPTAEENDEPESTTAEAQVQQTNTVSSSDEISAIEADIEATDLDSMDAEMAAIEAELEAEANNQ